MPKKQSLYANIDFQIVTHTNQKPETKICGSFTQQCGTGNVKITENPHNES